MVQSHFQILLHVNPGSEYLCSRTPALDAPEKIEDVGKNT